MEAYCPNEDCGDPVPQSAGRTKRLMTYAGTSSFGSEVYMCPVCKGKQYFATRGNEKFATQCFVASTIYGSTTAPEVVYLRAFRDDVLMRMPLGRAFVRVYYSGLGQTSAHLVRLTGTSGRAACRRFLSLFGLLSKECN